MVPLFTRKHQTALGGYRVKTNVNGRESFVDLELSLSDCGLVSSSESFGLPLVSKIHSS